MKKLIVPIAVLGLMTGSAFAQDAATTDFATLDTDLNGELSFTEVTVGWPELTEEQFDAADADMSGGLSVDELSAVIGGAASVPAPVPDATTLPAPAPADGAMTPVVPQEPAPAPDEPEGAPRSLVEEDD